MAKVVVYSTASCPYCDWAKQLLDNKNIPYSEIRVDHDTNLRDEMVRLSGRRTVPQIFDVLNTMLTLYPRNLRLKR